MESEILSTLYMLRVISFLYAGSHWLLHNLTDMCQKPSACIGLCMGMVSKAYQWMSLYSPARPLENPERHVDRGEDFGGRLSHGISGQDT
jgi:hypothetical protein